MQLSYNISLKVSQPLAIILITFGKKDSKVYLTGEDVFSGHMKNELQLTK